MGGALPADKALVLQALRLDSRTFAALDSCKISVTVLGALEENLTVVMWRKQSYRRQGPFTFTPGREDTSCFHQREGIF